MRKRELLLLCVVLFASVNAHARARVQRHANAVSGRYMVLLTENLSSEAYEGLLSSLAATYNFRVATPWRTAPRGFVCDNLSPADHERLANDPRISLIEDDAELSAPQLAAIQDSFVDPDGSGPLPYEYLWHLDRLDEATFGARDGSYELCPEARSVYAYVLDTGVRTNHVEFENRVVLSRAFDNDNPDGVLDMTNGCYDPNFPNDAPHGTWVASALAGTRVGASKAQIISLRTLTCSGISRASWLINAVRWIRSAPGAVSPTSQGDPFRTQASLVNLSAGTPSWQPSDFTNVNAAVDALVTAQQIPFFTAANNYSADACMFSPASLAYTNVNRNGKVFVVGGTTTGAYDTNDYRWQIWDGSTQRIGINSGSNAGSCVSIYAPAAEIYVADKATTDRYLRQSGTSFAAPLTAGVAARYMERTGLRTYAQVYNYLLDAAASTGTPLYNVTTTEYWHCVANNLNYRSNPGTCPAGDAPVHFPAVGNSSSAGILYTGTTLTCP